jgi:hypothetical protein
MIKQSKILFSGKKILLVLIGVSVLSLADMSRDAVGIVTDSATGLQWQDDYSDNGDVIKRANWKDAIGYCNELSLGGHNDWRLPNINELLSIVDYTKYNPAIDDSFQNVTPNRWKNYWSSTTIVNYPSHAWDVDFRNGYNSFNDKSASYTSVVRCVRSGQ